GVGGGGGGGGGGGRGGGGRGPGQPPAPAPAAPVEEPRRITLLYVGLIASSDEAHSPEVTRALEGVIDKARAFGGWVDSVRPAGAVVAFGVDPAEDAPRRAVHAAAAIRRMAIRARRDEPSRPEVRSAPHAVTLGVARADGEVIIEADGKRRAMEVLEALVSHADAGHVVVSSTAAVALGRHFELEPLSAQPEGTPAYRPVSHA